MEPLPSLKYWFRESAIYDATVFLAWTVVVTYVGLNMQGPWFYLFCTVAVMFVLWTWSRSAQAAKESEASAEKTSKKDQQLDDAHALVRRLATKFETKILSVENLGRMSGEDMRGHVADLAARMRVFERGYKEAMRSTFPGFGSVNDTNEQREARFKKDMDDSYRRTIDLQASFAEQFLGDALALRGEMCRRLAISDETIRAEHVVALDHGMIAGVNPISEAANQLERLARRLAE